MYCNIAFEHDADISLESIAVKWFTQAVAAGLNIQHVGKHANRRHVKETNFPLELKSLKVEQRLQWASFDKLKKCELLKDIMEAFDDSATLLTARDANGLNAVHVAAVYNRIDVLSWFVDSKSVFMSEKDASRRTVLQVAVASNACGD
jgi:hypothetical protein